MFNLIHRVDRWLLLLNLGFLLCIGSLPFPTALVSAYLQNPAAQRTAVFVYQGTILACAVFFNAVWRYASIGHRLIDPRLDPEFIREVTRLYDSGLLTYVVSVLAALWSARGTGYRSADRTCVLLPKPAAAVPANSIVTRSSFRVRGEFGSARFRAPLVLVRGTRCSGAAEIDPTRLAQCPMAVQGAIHA
jgi:hypothetical protein